MFFLYFASWQRVAELDHLWQKRQTDQMALSCPLSLPTIQDVTVKCVGFLKLEAWLIRRIRSSCLPRQRALWYLRPSGADRLRDSANLSQGRTNVNIQSTPVEWAVRKGGVGLTYHARLNRSPSRAPHQSFSMSLLSNQWVHFCLA